MERLLRIPSEWQAYHQRGGLGSFYLDRGDVHGAVPFQFDAFKDRITFIERSKLNKAHGRNQDKANPVSESEIDRLGHTIFNLNSVWHHMDYEDMPMTERSSSTDELGIDIKTSHKTFIFGAGASSFCVTGNVLDDYRSSSDNLPLGNEVFLPKYMDVRQKYRGVGPTVRFFNGQPLTGGKTVEECLEDEWRSCLRHNPAVLSRHINIQFYLQDLFSSLSLRTACNYADYNLYGEFARRLQIYISDNLTQNTDWRYGREEIVNLITFNQDTLLEQAMNECFDVPIDSMESYYDTKHRKVAVYKPHGSCNWGWPILNPDFMNLSRPELVDYLYDNRISRGEIDFQLLGYGKESISRFHYGNECHSNENHLGKYALNRDKIEFITDLNDRSHLPALLIPYAGKDEFVMPYRHQSEMRTALDHTAELVLIGWKANEQAFNYILKRVVQNKFLKKITIIDKDCDTVRRYLEKWIGKEILSGIEFDTSMGLFEDYVLQHMDGHLRSKSMSTVAS